MSETYFANNASLSIKNDLIRGTKMLLKVIKEKILTENYFSHVIW
jgi:hypothetical protein